MSLKKGGSLMSSSSLIRLAGLAALSSGVLGVICKRSRNALFRRSQVPSMHQILK
jgi:hypothetical protein